MNYLHTSSWAGLLVTPVDVISTYGAKRLRVRLRHQHRFNRVTYAAGTVRIVPSEAVTSEPVEGAYVSVGRGKHIPKRAWLKRIAKQAKESV